ncbi:GNAT family N-acetyltransferase [Microbispora sp. NBRC 16548]|uniref:GNAT family N-acetyltransferase n=1 Tax=Microbispora sp. NBRC 16548 TaxID=3030994 RepID=UPI0024A52529|nr:GNAT family N-acetyltransferase [Microbispora sp. NBRC 16548]GLX10971.1 hypothetical protein Misp03_78970 [Microbispora sp. NBRC 16548]
MSATAGERGRVARGVPGHEPPEPGYAAPDYAVPDHAALDYEVLGTTRCWTTRCGTSGSATPKRPRCWPASARSTRRGTAPTTVSPAGETVAGGAFRRYDAVTAELKRIWAHPSHRRRGLGRAVVRVLEREAAARGYRRVYLTTGPRQPEAAALYLASGYTPLFDVDDRPVRGPLPFVKDLSGVRPGAPGRDPLREAEPFHAGTAGGPP